MQVSFRQGIVRYEVLQSPPLLSRTSMSGTSVDLNIVDSPAIINFCHYGANGSAGIPIVDVFIDVDGTTQKVIANVTMNDKNNVTVSFAQPQTGYAIVIV